MLLKFALAAGLAACSADPAPTGAYAPRALPAAFEQAQHPAHKGGATNAGCSTCGGNFWHSCGPESFRCHFLFSPCDMYQHFPYWNKERGYYYFRPYHVAHVVMQQEKAAVWGIDVHNPYDNRSLDEVYEQWADEQELLRKTRKVEPLPRVPGQPETEEPEATSPAPTPPPGDGSRLSPRQSLKKFVRTR